MTDPTRPVPGPDDARPDAASPVGPVIPYGAPPAGSVPPWGDGTSWPAAPVPVGYGAYAAGPVESRRSVRAATIGWLLIGLTILGLFLALMAPAPFVIQRPGPVVDVLGDVEIEDEVLPVIGLTGIETFPTEGALRMLTVNIAGGPTQLPTWAEVVRTYFSPSDVIVPVDQVYPPGVTVESSSEAARIEMENSQQAAVAAAVNELDMRIDGFVQVESLSEGSPAEGILQAGDRVLSINGIPVVDVPELRAEIANNGVESPATLVITRAGVEQTVEVLPIMSSAETPVPVIGILASSNYDFPFEVEIELQNIGGPSAGMIFALGIYDKLTGGSLTGGADVAGTGTIDSAGTVGPIGGIRQKMWGALRAGSTWFLAPSANCDEVVGHIPSGLRVFSVDTLDDAVTVLETIADGDETAISALPTCEAP